MHREPQTTPPEVVPGAREALHRSSSSVARTSLIAFLCFLAALVFYLVTLQPSLAWGDGIRLQREAVTGRSYILDEMVDVSFASDPFPFARLGVAAWDHPLYVMLGHGVVRLVPENQALWSVNAISAFFAAATISLFYLLTIRHTRSQAASLLAAMMLAVSHTFWWHAVTPEVYSLFSFLLLLSVYSVDRYEQHGRFAALLVAAFALGLGISNHLLAALALLALPLYLLLAGRPPGDYVQRPRQWAWLLLAFLAGLSPYLIQFARLLRTFSFTDVLGPAAGVAFLQGSLALSPTLLLQSLASYLIFLLYNFLLVGAVLGIYGWWIGRDAYRTLWAKAVALYAVYLVFGLIYRVSDQFAFFLAAHLFFAVTIAMGIARLSAQAWPAARRRLLIGVLTLPVLLTPLLYSMAPDLLRAVGITESDFGVPQVGTGVRDGLAYYIDPNKNGEVQAVVFGYETLANLPPNALILANWYTDTDEYFVLRYLAVVEGQRPDVTVEGWPTADILNFDPAQAARIIQTEIDRRPIYLASLSEQFYAATQLLDSYCIFPELNLYRILSKAGSNGRPCLPPTVATP